MPDVPVSEAHPVQAHVIYGPDSRTHDLDHQDIDDHRGWSYPLPQVAVNRMFYHLVSYHGMHGDPRIGDDDSDLDPGNIMHFFRQHHDNEGTPTGSMTVHKTASVPNFEDHLRDYHNVVWDVDEFSAGAGWTHQHSGVYLVKPGYEDQEVVHDHAHARFDSLWQPRKYHLHADDGTIIDRSGPPSHGDPRWGHTAHFPDVIDEQQHLIEEGEHAHHTMTNGYGEDPDEGDYVIDDAGISQLGTRGKHWDVPDEKECPQCHAQQPPDREPHDPRGQVEDCPTCKGNGEVGLDDDELSESRHLAIHERQTIEGYFPNIWHAEDDAPLEDWRLCDHYKETNDPRFRGFRYKAYRSRIDPRGPERSTCQNCGQPCHLQFHDKFWVHDDTSDMFHPLYHETRRGLDCADAFDDQGYHLYVTPADRDRPPEQREASIENDHKPSYEPTGFIGGIPYSIASCSCSWKTNIRSQAASEAAWARHFKGVDEEGRREQAGEPREDAFVPKPTKRWGPVESAVINNGCKRCGGWGTIQIPRTMPDSVDPRNPQGLGSSYGVDPSERGALAPDNPRNLQPGKWSVQMLCPVCRGVNSSEWWKESKTATRWGTCECGHSFDDHGSNPPHTGFMWCEGAGMEKIGEGGVGYGDPRYDEQDPRAGGPDCDWKCRCREFDGDELDDNGKPIVYSKVAMEGYPSEDLTSSRKLHPEVTKWLAKQGINTHLHEDPNVVSEAGEPDDDAYSSTDNHIFHHPDIDQDRLDAVALHEAGHSLQVRNYRFDEGGRDTIAYEQQAWDVARQVHDHLGLNIPQEKWDAMADEGVGTYKKMYNRRVPERLRFPTAHREGDPRHNVWEWPSELENAAVGDRRQWMQDHLVDEHGANRDEIPTDPDPDNPVYTAFGAALFNAYADAHQYPKQAGLTPEQRGPRDENDPRGHVVLPKKPRGGMKFHLLEWHGIDRDDPWYSTSEWAMNMDDEHYAIHQGQTGPVVDDIDLSNHRHAAWIDHVTSPVDPAALPQEEPDESPKLPPLYEGGYQIWPDQPEAERTPRAPANVMSGPKTGQVDNWDPHEFDHDHIDTDLDEWGHLLEHHQTGDPRLHPNLHALGEGYEPDDDEWAFYHKTFAKGHRFDEGRGGYVHTMTASLDTPENEWRNKPKNLWTCPNCGGPAGPREPGDPRFTKGQAKYRYCEDCDTECTSCGYINNDKDLAEAYTGHEKGDPRHEEPDWENYSPKCLACGNLLSD